MWGYFHCDGCGFAGPSVDDVDPDEEVCPRCAAVMVWLVEDLDGEED